MKTVAALYVDTLRGPYPHFEEVDCWGLERDATSYNLTMPVVCHPPCGPWSRYWYKSQQSPETALVAVGQVQHCGGVLEHPKDSKLWLRCQLPMPNCGRDQFGGYTVQVNQSDWGHEAKKATWLYVVGYPYDSLPFFFPIAKPVKPLEHMSKTKRHLTPTAFAKYLIDIAKLCKVGQL